MHLIYITKHLQTSNEEKQRCYVQSSNVLVTAKATANVKQIKWKKTEP
jgi:hypothetical protein